MTQRLCHAVDCNERIPPDRLMCPRHWYMVPAPLRTQVWQTYRPGASPPTQEYLDTARTVINHVAALEGKPQLPDTAAIIKTLQLMLEKHKGEKDAEGS
jgi:hypothetical protein